MQQFLTSTFKRLTRCFNRLGLNQLNLAKLNFFGLFSLAALTTSTSAYAQSQIVLRAAVASNFAASAKKLSAPFEQEYHLKIHWISGASGALYQQIRHGAPFDLFFSADRDHPQRLVEKGFIKPQTLTPYAIGQLAIYSAKHSSLNVQSIINRDIASKSITSKRIAIANPITAPYGKAAQIWLEQHGLWQQYRSKAIVGNNVNQTFQQTHSGAVDWGLVAVSQLIAHQLPVHQVTLANPEMLTQYAGVLASSKQAALAVKLIAFFKQAAQQEKLATLGYLPINAVSYSTLSTKEPSTKDKPSSTDHD